LIVFFLSLHGIDQTTRQLPLKTKLRKLDVPGIILMISSVSCLFLALQEGGVKEPWGSARPIGLLVGFGLLFIIFGIWQWKAGEDATVPVRYLKDRTVIWGSLYLFWDNMASYIVSLLPIADEWILTLTRLSTTCLFIFKLHFISRRSGAVLVICLWQYLK
jgi:hypothetical protein